VDAIKDFSNRLDISINFLKHPQQNKVVHHHHVSRLIWITVCIFIAMSIECVGWYSTNNRLVSYIAIDTKYRYLRLDTANVILEKKLYKVDSLFNEISTMRDIVLAMEEKYQHNFELLRKANRMKAEAENLKTEGKKWRKKQTKNKSSGQIF
jgi:hypothetical protein